MSLRATVAKAQSEAKRKQSHEKRVLLEIAKPVPRPARNLAPRDEGERILDYLGNYLLVSYLKQWPEPPRIYWCGKY